MGAGDDTFVWDPGDGSDTVEGQTGSDTMALQRRPRGRARRPLGQRQPAAVLPRPRATSRWTPHGVETVDFNALGGADAVTVNDLTGTDVRTVDADLAGTLGGVTGDGATDTVVVNGTNGNDASPSLAAAGERERDAAWRCSRASARGSHRPTRLRSTRRGIDTLATGGLAAGAIQLFFDGVLVP